MAAKLVVVLALLACVSYCAAIKCYQCNSLGDSGKNCADPIVKDKTDGASTSNTQQRDCPNGMSWCSKMTIDAEKGQAYAGMTLPKGITVIRDCGNKPDYKAADNTATLSEWYCQGDGCNGASSMTMSALVAGAVAVFAFAANRV